jgi:hypothetical protein
VLQVCPNLGVTGLQEYDLSQQQKQQQKQKQRQQPEYK